MPKKVSKMSAREALALSKKVEDQKKEKKRVIEMNRVRGEIKRTSLYPGLDY